MPKAIYSDPVKLQKLLKSKPERYWQKRGEKMALSLFREMSERVPAYKDFLAKKHFDPRSVKNIEHLKNVPLIDKDNYLRAYPLDKLCWDGRLADQPWVISSTSGSTGEPFYFPRGARQDEYYAATAEAYLRENFRIHERSTLYVDAFAMGAWIGGVFTYEAVNRVAKKGYALSITTPGINKAEVVASVKRLGSNYDQVIIGCYPPILKDIIDLGLAEGLDWGKYNLGIVFSAEGFGEEFRDYIFKYGKLANIYTSTLNHYGTVDMGTMSHETPVSIMMRRLAIDKPQLFQALFGEAYKQPTVTQYVPEMFFFEEVDGGVVCSGYTGLPLVRYDLKDHGGVFSLAEAESIFKQMGIDLRSELKVNAIEQTLWNLPFVYLYERSDFSVTFSGAQIYPEEIRRALHSKELENLVTGRFTMLSGYDKKARNYLEINVEMKRGVKAGKNLSAKVLSAVVEKLLLENSEYKVLYSEGKSKLHPKIVLWEHGHERYFHERGKQKWSHKSAA
jgi:phenylacetate-CoA ligase